MVIWKTNLKKKQIKRPIIKIRKLNKYKRKIAKLNHVKEQIIIAVITARPCVKVQIIRHSIILI